MQYRGGVLDAGRPLRALWSRPRKSGGNCGSPGSEVALSSESVNEISLQCICGWFDSSSPLSLSTPETTARESGGKLAEVLGVDVRTVLELVVV